MFQGIFLTKVHEDGPAAQAGLLVGDKLLSVNGTSLINCEHGKAVAALKKAGDQIEMIVLREILQTSDEHQSQLEDNHTKDGEKFSTVLQRDEKHGGNFGFSIAGGNSTNHTVNGHENLYISKVNKHDQQSIEVGDRLLAINGQDTAKLNHDQAIEIIKDGGDNVELLIYREKMSNGHHHPSVNHIDHTVEVCSSEIRIVFCRPSDETFVSVFIF